MTGQDVRAFLTKAGMSASALAAVAGVDRSLLSLWLSGKRDPSRDFERRVSRTIWRLTRLSDAFKPVRLNLDNPKEVQAWMEQLEAGTLPVVSGGIEANN